MAAPKALVGRHFSMTDTEGGKFHRFAAYLVARNLAARAGADRDVQAQPEPDTVAACLLDNIEKRERWLCEAYHDFRGIGGQAIAGGTVPAPGPDLESHRSEGLRHRLGRNARLVHTTPGLAAHQFVSPTAATWS
jgi:hypothetical protein